MFPFLCVIICEWPSKSYFFDRREILFQSLFVKILLFNRTIDRRNIHYIWQSCVLRLHQLPSKPASRSTCLFLWNFSRKCEWAFVHKFCCKFFHLYQHPASEIDCRHETNLALTWAWFGSFGRNVTSKISSLGQSPEASDLFPRTASSLPITRSQILPTQTC